MAIWLIGSVTSHDPTTRRIEVELRNDLQVGDRICFRGDARESIRLVKSLRVGDQPVDQAAAGVRAVIELDRPVARAERVYSVPDPPPDDAADDSLLTVVQRSRLVRIVELLLLVIAVATAAWWLVRTATDRPELELIVRVGDDNVIFPSADTGGNVLPLEFEGVRPRSITISEITIENGGKSTIGTQAETWVLTLTAPDAARLAVVSEVGGRGAAREVRSVAPNSVEVVLGVLPQDHDVGLDLMIVDPADRRFPTLTATSSLAGLDPPTVTRADARSSVAARLLVPVFVIVLATLLVSSAYEHRDEAKRRQLLQRKRSIVWILLLAVVLALITAVFVSLGLAFLVEMADRFL